MDPVNAPSTSRTHAVAVSPATSAAGAVALALLIVGGLNWALVGLFEFDLVAAIFGPMSLLSRIVYVVVGLAAVWALTLFPRVSRGA
jgi:uncharacterized membrane protein YuzA (DUF378 family)